jgi:hypothetical protein
MEKFYTAVDSTAVSGRFMDRPVLMVKKSHEQGKPVYENRVYVEIKVDGMSDVFPSPVRDYVQNVGMGDIQRFPEAWQAYLDSKKTDTEEDVVESEPEQPKRKTRKKASDKE